MARKMEKDEECCSSGSCGGSCGCEKGMAGLIFLFGIAWLGSEMHWWSLNLPWLPILVILFAIMVMGKGVCGGCK